MEVSVINTESQNPCLSSWERLFLTAFSAILPLRTKMLLNPRFWSTQRLLTKRKVDLCVYVMILEATPGHPKAKNNLGRASRSTGMACVTPVGRNLPPFWPLPCCILRGAKSGWICIYFKKTCEKWYPLRALQERELYFCTALLVIM